MGQVNKLMGIIKDKVSQSKAALLLSNSAAQPLHIALLRATTHDPFSPPSPKHLSTFLSFGKGSRATASAAIHVLMDRLQTTRNSAVALKCLIIVHHIIAYGSFILQDQLSVYPFHGGRNYLKLSNFRDNSTPLTWDLSSWVRWYAQYVEQLLCTSRDLGFFLGSCSCASSSVTEKKEKAVSLLNRDLIRETDALVALGEEICKGPDCSSMEGNRVVDRIVNLVGEDYGSAIMEISIRMKEFKERLGCLSFGESVELICALKRLEKCKERMENLGKKEEMEGLWDLIREVKEKLYKEEGKFSAAVKRDRLPSESARFDGPSLLTRDMVRFPSAKLLASDNHFLD